MASGSSGSTLSHHRVIAGGLEVYSGVTIYSSNQTSLRSYKGSSSFLTIGSVCTIFTYNLSSSLTGLVEGHC
jgi:hypothetical protein